MTIDKYNFAGKKAIVRVDFNVPLKDGKITDDTRIRGALPTLKLILEKGGALIIMSHMGKPKGKVKPELSLGQIVDAVSAALGTPVKFVNDCMKADAEAAALKPGEVLLLENLRFYPEEEGKPVGLDKGTPEYDEAKKALKATQKEFAKKLASYADCWVMDAFGTAHRKHASTAVIADYFDADNKMLGLLMEKEVKAVDNVLNNIQRPFIAIMGGSKVSSKIGIIENLLGKVDKLILCGGMTYTFAKAHGGEIGKSIVEMDKLDVALGVEELAKKNGVELVMAPDAVCCTSRLALRFLADYQVSAMIPNQISLDSYMDTFLMLLFVMGLVFEMPLVAWVLSKIGLLTRGFFRRYRRHAVVVLLILAAVITPTGDPFTLMIVFIPLYLLYELSALIVKPAPPVDDEGETSEA